MILLAATVLGLLFASFWWIARQSKGERDFLSPRLFVPFFTFITTVPFLVVLGFDNNALNEIIRNHPDVINLDDAVAWYACVQGVGFLALMAGIWCGAGKRIAEHIPAVGTDFTLRRCRMAQAVMLFGGIGAFLLFVRNAGGLPALILMVTTYSRAKFSLGQGAVVQMMALLQIGTIISTYSLGKYDSRTQRAILGVFFVTSAILFTALGGRTTTVQLIIFSLFGYHYGVARITRLNARVIAAVVFVGFYIVGMSVIRHSGGFSSVANKGSSTVTDIAENAVDLAGEISRVDVYLLVTNHFRPENIYMGATYRDLITIPVPRSVMPDKPPADDGVYIATIGLGHTAQPGSPLRTLFPSSWPPETLGASYMNFYVPGVIVFMFFLGIVYSTAYAYMAKTGYTFHSIMCYCFTILAFQFSNIRIVQVGSALVIISILCLVFFQGRVRQSPGELATTS